MLPKRVDSQCVIIGYSRMKCQPRACRSAGKRNGAGIHQRRRML